MPRRLALLALLFGNTLWAQPVRLPSASPLFVMQGGDTRNVNHHMVAHSQEFGVDFTVVGGSVGRELSRAPGTHVEDFYCWNSVVLSPVAGRVVESADSLPDNAIGTKDGDHPLGNHVVIRQRDRYLYVAHLRQHSLRVKTGDNVAAGQAIGRCGNSGNSDYPHIHVHATNSPNFGEASGINLIYGPMRVNLAGKTFENVEWPLLQGLWVQQP